MLFYCWSFLERGSPSLIKIFILNDRVIDLNAHIRLHIQGRLSSKHVCSSMLHYCLLFQTYQRLLLFA